jgi:hypothetical protein
MQNALYSAPCLTPRHIARTVRSRDHKRCRADRRRCDAWAKSRLYGSRSTARDAHGDTPILALNTEPVPLQSSTGPMRNAATVGETARERACFWLSAAGGEKFGPYHAVATLPRHTLRALNNEGTTWRSARSGYPVLANSGSTPRRKRHGADGGPTRGLAGTWPRPSPS